MAGRSAPVPDGVGDAAGPVAVPGDRHRSAPAITALGVHVRSGPPFPGDGTVTLLEGVDLDVRPGEVLAVVGRRGAGTSTLLSVLSGRTRPSEGVVRVLGRDPAGGAGDDDLATLPSHAALFDHLTVEETLSLWAGLRSRPGAETGELLDLAGLTGAAHRLVRGLDHGHRQRVQLAVTFAGAAPVVVCDEPVGGAAPGTGAALAALLRRHRAGGGTAVVAGGRPEVLETADGTALLAACDRVGVLRRGRLVVAAPARDVVDRFASHGGVSALVGDAGEASSLAATLPGATFQRVGELTRVDVPDVAPERWWALTAALTTLREVRHHDATLADAVRRATADRRPADVRPPDPRGTP
ncbi:ATP-binding cassette domain-containing protein [Kineococcus sp. TBRC 1896]|uniref:ATP-binding cassette domain-containing protein n=1 Tax=Kineococcus mangrovi TaxID=1660183 RepID=A0ABV4I888_9ACTN